MTFANSARNYTNFTRTENDAVALKSTGNPLLDLFATAGALRVKSEGQVTNMFQSALAQDKLLATKLMFYTRNVRGGLGERETFRRMLKSLVSTNPEIVVKNIEIIPVFGRYDDLYTLVDTEAEAATWSFIRKTIAEDARNMLKGESVSLCAKWLKSINTSSKKSNELGRKTAKALGLSERNYRKMLTDLRKHIKVLESKMSAKLWEEIDYSAVPSRAMKNYRGAFQKHDEARFSKFIEKVATGEEKIHAATLYPYDILMAAELKNSWGDRNFIIKKDAVLEAQWKALPDYVEGENNVLVMADTSGSMETSNGLPMATSIGLAIYFAERNKGAYKNLFLTFSDHPQFVELKGKSLAEKVACVESICANTNLEAAMQLILDVAIKHNVPQEEMPKSLIVITDMQFDACVEGARFGETFHDTIKRKFVEHGYTMPTVIYWMVEARQSAFQVKANDENVVLVSGQSTSTFKSVLGSVGRTPFDFMLEVLNNPMYDCVSV